MWRPTRTAFYLGESSIYLDPAYRGCQVEYFSNTFKGAIHCNILYVLCEFQLLVFDTCKNDKTFLCMLSVR